MKVAATLVPTDAQPHEAPPGERREWPSLDAWFEDDQHYWFPDPEEKR